jgi:hypothetical protein
MTKRKSEIAEPNPPSIRDAQAIEEASQWMADRKEGVPLPPQYRATFTDGQFSLDCGHDDRIGALVQLCRALGVSSHRVAEKILFQLANGPGVKARDAASISQSVNDGLDFICSQKPDGEVQAMVLAQAWATNTVANLEFRSALGTDNLNQLEISGTLAVKAGKLFIQQVEALNKLRHGGKQQVEVRYIYVDARGSNNIIAPGAAGGSEENQQRPYGPARIPGLAFAPGVPMPSENEGGDLVPIARHEEQEALPHPRREVPRRTKGGEKR